MKIEIECLPDGPDAYCATIFVDGQPTGGAIERTEKQAVVRALGACYESFATGLCYPLASAISAAKNSPDQSASILIQR